jgi:hypothetical protein
MKRQIEPFFGNFKKVINNLLDKNLDKNKDELLNILNGMELTVLTLIEINKNIENLNNQIEFSNYIANLPQNNQIKHFGLSPKYENEISKLKKTIFANIIIEKYEEAIKAFEYWSFPFFCQFTKDIEIIKKRNYDYHDFDTNTYILNLENIKKKIEDSNTIINSNIDNNIQYFKNYHLYEWSSKIYANEISSLFQGNKVKMLADVNKTNYDALKFNEIHISIEINSSNQANTELDNLLKKNFYVELTHSGLSFYKIKEKKYMIDLNYKTDEKILVRYKYGNIESNNAVSKKLTTNKPLLSPFTLWQIQIKPTKSVKEPLIFDKISSLIKNQEVIIYLVGSGAYLRDDFKEGECSIDRTYNAIKID